MLFFVWSVNQRVKLSGMHTLIIVRGVRTGGGRGAGALIKFRAVICDLQAPDNVHNYMHVSTQSCVHEMAPPHEKTSYAIDNVGSHTYTHVHVHMIL